MLPDKDLNFGHSLTACEIKGIRLMKSYVMSKASISKRILTMPLSNYVWQALSVVLLGKRQMLNPSVSTDG